MKKAAMEMSVGTIVTIVLLLSVLILGLVLIKDIFTGSKYNIDQINDKVKDEINKLFTEESKAVVYLPNRVARITPGEAWGVGFAIKNKVATQKFTWEVKLTDPDVQKKCGVTAADAESWITTGRVGEVSIPSGDTHFDSFRVDIPEGRVTDISKCIIRYQLIIKESSSNPYQTVSFDIQTE